MAHTSVLGQITDVTDANGQESIDCTIYQLGATLNESFVVSYDDLDASQKQVVDDFKALIVSLAPSNNP